MLDSAIIDVAFGLAFIFLLVSLLVTAATEILAGYLRWRSAQLWHGLERLLQSPDLRNALYQHPLVRGLSPVDLAGDANARKGRNGPSYIPSRTFALALIDIVRRPQEAAGRLEAALKDLPRDGNLFKAVETTLDQAAADAPPCVQAAVRTLRAKILQLRAGAVGDLAAEIDAFLAGGGLKGLSDVPEATFQALRPLLRDAADDVEKFRTNVETWFNDGMDRVSGGYKRRTTHVQAVIAMILAACMNIDALQITRTLWREPTLRRTIVASAEAQITKPLPATAATAAAPAPVPPAAGSAPAGAPAPPAADGPSMSGPSNAQATTPPDTAAFEGLAAQIGVLGLPIGWSCPVPEATGPTGATLPSAPAGPSSGNTDKARTAALSALGGPLWCTAKDSILAKDDQGNHQIVWKAVPSRIPLLLTMVFGWSITAAAASLGAPFWFDTLKRVASIRSSGKAPEEKPLPPKAVPQPLAPGQTPKDAALLQAFQR